MARIAAADLARNVPQLMQAHPNWIGSFSKRPIQLQGRRPAKVDDPSTWDSWQRALRFAADLDPLDNAYQIGFVFTREAKIVFVDLDHCLHNGELKSWARPLIEPLIGRYYIERSPSGNGLHIFALDWNDVLQVAPHRTGCRQPVGDGAVECYVERRFSTITGDVMHERVGLNPIDEGFLEMLRLAGLLDRLRGVRAPRAPGDEVVDEDEVRAALDYLGPDLAYDEWVRVGMALKRSLGDNGWLLWDEWSRRGQKYPGSHELHDKWQSFSPDGEVGVGTLFHLAREAGWSGGLAAEDVFDVISDEDLAKLDSGHGAYEEGNLKKWSALGTHTYVSGTGKSASVRCSEGATNIGIYIERHAGMQGLRLNSRSQQLELGGMPLDVAELQKKLTFFHEWRRTPSAQSVSECARLVARAYDPVAEWLEGLKWDGAQRLDDVCRMVGLEDSPIAKRSLRRWMIGAIARAIRPGCKMQNMLVLCGDQGPMKSTFFEKMAVRREWYREAHIDFDRDGQMILLGPWIVESGELSGLRKASIERVKVFISEDVSSFRRPYAASTESFPRRCVLGGTVNGDKFLLDSTGSRRFWVLRVTSPLRFGVLTEDYIAQLWAEARCAFESGERWWDSFDEVQEVNVRNEEFYDKSTLDGWVANILEDLGTTKATTVREVLRLLSSEHRVSQGTSLKSIATAIRLSGWAQKQYHIDGEARRIWAVPGTAGDSRTAAELAWTRSRSAFAPSDVP